MVRAKPRNTLSKQRQLSAVSDTLCVVVAGPLEFTTALHTYFATNDVHDIRVEGLRDLTYEDNAAGGATAREAQAEVAIASEVRHACVCM